MSRRNWTKPVEKKPAETKTEKPVTEEEIQAEVAENVTQIKATQPKAPEKEPASSQKSPTPAEQEDDPFDGIFRVFNSRRLEEVQELPGMVAKAQTVPTDEEMESLMGFLDAVQPAPSTEAEAKIAKLESEKRVLQSELECAKSENADLQEVFAKSRKLLAAHKELLANFAKLTEDAEKLSATNEKLQKENVALSQQLQEATAPGRVIQMFSPALAQMFASMDERLLALEAAFADEES